MCRASAVMFSAGDEYKLLTVKCNCALSRVAYALVSSRNITSACRRNAMSY